MTVFVMPDLIGHLMLLQGKGLPVGAGNDGEGRAGDNARFFMFLK